MIETNASRGSNDRSLKNDVKELGTANGVDVLHNVRVLQILQQPQLALRTQCGEPQMAQENAQPTDLNVLQLFGRQVVARNAFDGDRSVILEVDAAKHERLATNTNLGIEALPSGQVPISDGSR
jgi:hypothetical protein